jgi:methyl-accepting chemotaxis protein
MNAADPHSLMKDLVARQFDELILEVERAQAVVREAIPSITKAFSHVQSQVQNQFSQLMELSRQLGEEGQSGVLSTMRGVVDSFVKDLVTINSQSSRIVERVTLMSGDINQVMGNVANIEEMASTTRFIALNAHIEAHRSGVAGTAFRVVAEEVKHLAGDAHNFSGQIHSAVERFQTRLDETQVLVATLASHDVNGALAAQSRLLETVDGLRRANESLIVNLKILEGAVASALQALTFEAALTQLHTSVLERTTRLRAAWLELMNAPSMEAALEKNRALFDPTARPARPDAALL